MKINFPLLFISIALSIFGISAQDNPFPNEIEGLRFSKEFKFSQLKFLKSTRDDVMSIFGANCAEGCKYNDDWDVEFTYLKKEDKTLDEKNGVTLTYRARPNLVGKLITLQLLPRRPYILSESLIFPKGLQCRASDPSLEAQKLKVCWDGSVVAYYFHTEDNPKGKFRKNELVTVLYDVSNENRKDMFNTEPEPSNSK